MPGRFKDYIAMPKANLYQSLHTTVVRPNGEPAEIQIRTHEMHQTCELGVAAHWMYKERPGQTFAAGAPASAPDAKATDIKKFQWLRQIMEWQSELKDPDEFLEAVKVDLFEEEIFVFTPKGDVIQLPIGATTLDFAFNVHTKIGLTTVGAKINGRMVPLKKTLKSGDIVEVLTSPTQKPGKDWLNFVTTSKARNKIRAYLRQEQRDRSRQIGREMLSSELAAIGIDFDKASKTGDLEPLAKMLKEATLDEALVAIGYGRANLRELLPRLYPNKFPKPETKDTLKKAAESNATAGGPSSQTSSGTRHPKQAGPSPKSGGILVHGIENVLINFARCCHPLPGEQVVGFITRGRGVTVHRGSCPRALDIDPARRVEVKWAEGETEEDKGAHAAFLRVTAQDKPGVLADVTSAISTCGASIQRAQIRVTPSLTGIMEFEMTLKSLTQLQAIIRKVESLPHVLKVERMSTHRLNKRS